MLISMPTDTSTIFGVFQVIRDPPNQFGATFTPEQNLGPPRTQRKYGTSTAQRWIAALALEISLSDKVTSLLGKCERRIASRCVRERVQAVRDRSSTEP